MICRARGQTFFDNADSRRLLCLGTFHHAKYRYVSVEQLLFTRWKKTILTWWSLASFHLNRINTSIFVLHLSVRKRHPRRLKLYKTSEMLYKEDGRKIPTPSIVKQEILSLILLVLLTDAETDLSNAPIDTFLPSYQIFLPPPLTYG